MASPVPVDRLISHEQIEYLKTVDSPTIANALETFNVRDRTEGYIGGAVRSMFPDLGVMVGYALTATITNQRGETASRDGYWKMWETLEQMPRPSVVVMQDFSGEP